VRNKTETVEANYEQLQGIINRRIQTQYSSAAELTLEEHLAQLKLLYSNIERYRYIYSYDPPAADMLRAFDAVAQHMSKYTGVTNVEKVDNANYPE
jgi:hypothetical protein